MPVASAPRAYLSIPIGSDYNDGFAAYDVNGAPPDWTGVSARMQIRTDYGGDLIATLSTSTPRDGTITLAADGNVVLFVPASFTLTLTPTARAVFDIEFTLPGGRINRGLAGFVDITPEVTTNA